ncbi:MAG: C10 family peptidase, partial [Bacteroidia bacterium]|nr:C10 family peptidase [Bacteroidia bacterium]
EGAALDAYKTTLPLYFGYSNEMKSIESWNYNIGEVIRHQLSLRHPVPADWIGQAFVIDGYFPDNLFHFNMGWGGEFNGFYLLDYPVVKVDTDHSLLTCYTDYHPKSILPGVTNLTAAPEGDSIRISWNTNMGDSLHSMLIRFVVLRDGLVPIAQTTQSTVVVSTATMGGSSSLRVVADFGLNGASELSAPFLYISDQTVADIPSLALRQMINTKIGASDLLRQPFVGELELIKDLEINFADQRGLEKLPQLKNLRIDGTNIRVLRDGDYLERLLHLRFFNCVDFGFTIFGKTRSLIQLYGYDFLPFDLYEFRHNADLGLLQFTTTGTNPNMLMDLYGADKYFPKLADFFLRHLAAGPGANFEDCFVSYESYKDVYPKIKSNLNLLSKTKPSVFAPCYPVPARNANLPAVTRLSWQCNNNNETGVFYNVFVGNSRGTLELVSVFQMDKFYDGTFEPNNDYFWRVEAYHTDSTYYSGIYHFSTWQDLPIPFIERFDSYYSQCPITGESPFWITFDNTLTGKAVTNRNTKYEGFYSLELKPKSDAGVLIKQPVDPMYYIEFRFLNQGGQIATELLQKSGSSDDNIVNSKIEFLGTDIGLFTYAGSTFPFTFVSDQWNRVNISLNMNTGAAAFSLNEVVLKEWQWHVQIGGTANANPFKGIRFANAAGSTGGSGFVDNLIIDLENPLSTNPALNPEIGMVYLPGSREVKFSGIEPGEIRDITLYDIQGRLLVVRQNPDNLIFPIGSSVRNGVYLVVVNRKDGRPFSSKIAVLKQ